MKIATLHKVGNTPVFYSPDLVAVRQEYYSGILEGTYVCYDAGGAAMDKIAASEDFLIYADFEQKPTSQVSQIFRNIKVGLAIISCVRSELMNIAGGMAYLSKLSPVIGAIQVGMLDTASIALRSMIPDDILTDEQLDRWASLCEAADAVVV